MQYQENIPSPQLQPFIKCYWLLSDDSGMQHDFEKIIPDGSPELIIHLGTPFEERVDGRIRKQEMAFVYGQLFASIEIRPSSKPRVVGIKFHPFGLSAFTTIPQLELSGKRSLVKDIFPAFPIEEYLERLNSAAIPEGLFLQIDQMMLIMLRKQKNFSEDKACKMSAAVSSIQQSNGSLKIDALTRSLNMSGRELERKFNRYIGLSPKRLAKIFRLQFALQSESKAELLTHLALDAGYYDQAHFIREFTSIVNERPSDYFAVETKLTEKFLLK
ncbi:MAG TPA: helix-turn-helix domain-containing protein [Chitinophagaceae bacterium]|nr:helix-turn-helix domain-containing protein [Chitinophagaceae bacterium]